MAYSVRIQRTALKELEEIVSYLAAFGPETAKSFLNDWRKALESLRDGIIDHRLSRFDTLAKLGYHTVLVKGYIALYYIESDEVVVAHIFHQSQDYASLVIRGI